MTGPASSIPTPTEPAMHDPHPGVECCPCVERLRAQNKASSDAWSKRTGEMQSDLYGLRSLMAEARTLHRKGNVGISMYGQAALAAALDAADTAEGKVEMLEEALRRERRLRLAAERDLLIVRTQQARTTPKCPRCGFGQAPAASVPKEDDRG